MAGGRWSTPQLWLLSFLLLISGCAETNTPLAAPPPSLSFEELIQRVSRIRGLPFQSGLSLETKGAEGIRALLEDSIAEEHGKETLSLVAKVYARLGLLTEITDLSKALLDLSLYQQAFHFDSRRKRIILPQPLSRPTLALLGFPRMTEAMAEQLLLTQALAHILQEQHFGLLEQLKRRSTEDLGLAIGALMKGDAVLVSLAHLMGDVKADRQKILDVTKGLSRYAAQIDKDLDHLPDLLRQKAIFQYVQGSQFVLWAYSLKGWEGVNGLFANPPLSSQQILHPENYYVKRKEPIRITPWGLFRQFRGKKIMDETLGDFLIQFLLSRNLSKNEAAQAAAGWAGDSFVVFQEGDQTVLGWITAWDDRERALEFYRSYRTALERRHGITLEPASGSIDTLTAPSQSGRSLLLQIRENFVFFLDGVPLPRSVEIAEGLWKELETGSEPQPFELGRVGRQSLSVIK